MRFSDQCPVQALLGSISLLRGRGKSAIEESMPQSIRELIGAAGRAEHGRSAAFSADDSHGVAQKGWKATTEMRLIRM